MAILVLGHIVVTPVRISTGASSATRFAKQTKKVTIPAFTSLCSMSPCLTGEVKIRSKRLQSAQGGDGAAYTRFLKDAQTGCDNELVVSTKQVTRVMRVTRVRSFLRNSNEA